MDELIRLKIFWGNVKRVFRGKAGPVMIRMVEEDFEFAERDLITLEGVIAKVRLPLF